jgi:hypothetical protein
VIPFLPVAAGLAVGVWRFRIGDALGGLAATLGGVLGMLVLVLWIQGLPGFRGARDAAGEMSPRARRPG